MNRVLFRTVFSYILITTGIYMFLLSYSNSYNRLTTEKIAPASLNITGSGAELKIIGHKLTFGIDKLMPDSKIYYVLYILTPDELRLLLSAADHFR